MLCTKIATDIRLSSIESISDWITRVSKDIPAWREDLEFIESEILKIDTESRTLSELHKHNRRLIELSKAEDELVQKLKSIQVEYSSTMKLTEVCAGALDELRGISPSDNIFCKYLDMPLPMMKKTPAYVFDDWTHDNEIYWDKWTDGIEIARTYATSLVYLGYGQCTKCKRRVEGGEYHTCRPTENIINHTLMDPPVIAKPTATLPVSRPSDESVIKPGRCESTSRECPLHYEFSPAGQTHYCTLVPVETSGDE